MLQRRPKITVLLVAVGLLGGCAGEQRSHFHAVPAEELEQPGSPRLMKDGKAVGITRQGLVFAFEREFPEPFKESCQRAARTWNQALGVSLLQFKPEPAGYSKSPDGESVISWGKDPQIYESNHAAEARVALAGAKIFEADIDFDLRNYSFSASAEPGKADVESVCLHEMGHALGLGHSDDPRSVMYPVLNVGTAKRRLAPEDVANARQSARSESNPYLDLKRPENSVAI